MKFNSRLRDQIISATLLVWIVAIWILFAPAQFGGQASYVIIAGASMEPTLQSGDLVVARQSSGYQIGDIVTYSHPQVGSVIHRIIDTTGNRYILQGDNNDWIDSYQPTNEDIYGKSWITVPGAAKAINHLRTPVGLTLLSVLIGLMLLVTISRGSSKEENQSDLMNGKKAVATKYTFSDLREGWILPLLTILLGGILFGVFAFSKPILETISIEVPYQHRGVFSYYAKAAPSVYDQGLIETGDAIFHSVVRKFDVTFDYELSAPSTQKISGVYQLFLELSEPNGWRRRLELIPATTFEKNTLRMSTTVDITRIQWLIGHMQNRTNFDRSAFDVRIIPVVDLNAYVAGQKIEDQFTPSLHFKLDDYQLYLNGTTPFEENGDPFNPIEIKIVEQHQQVPAKLSILGLEILVERARWIAGTSVAIALIGLAYILIPVMRSWQQGSSSRIALQFSEILLDVDKLPKTTAVKTIEVTDFSDLAKLSQSIGAPILHLAKKDMHTYLLQYKEHTYRYTLDEEKGEE